MRPRPVALADDQRAAGRPVPGGGPDHLLHVFPSFGIGGVPLRMARIFNHCGIQLRHSIIALDGDFGAAEHISPGIDFSLLAIDGARRGLARTLIASIAALRRLRPDQLVTYNWGAIEWAMANRLLPMARHIHLESGFGKEEADRQIRRRVVFRRWALARSRMTVVPSHRLEELAVKVWKLPRERIAYIPNGVDLTRFENPSCCAVPGFVRRAGQVVVGTVAPLRPEKNVGRLVRVFAGLDRSHNARLVIAGDGAERQHLGQLAAELGIEERVVFTGRVAPEAVLGAFDIFALSSDTEQMPNALLEAMAASRSVAAVDVGDVKAILSPQNRDFVVPRDEPAAFVAAISRLIGDPAKRDELGRRNRQRVTDAFSQERMFAAYSRIFGVATAASSVAAVAG